MLISVTGYHATIAALAAAARELANGNLSAIDADRSEETTDSQWAHRKSARLLSGKGSSKGKS